jgi:hypothetical protein
MLENVVDDAITLLDVSLVHFGRWRSYGKSGKQRRGCGEGIQHEHFGAISLEQTTFVLLRTQSSSKLLYIVEQNSMFLDRALRVLQPARGPGMN